MIGLLNFADEIYAANEKIRNLEIEVLQLKDELGLYKQAYFEGREHAEQMHMNMVKVMMVPGVFQAFQASATEEDIS